jgi:outer membrane protein OmpU
MKNLLIASTALVASAGFAVADLSLSGAANVGILDNSADDAFFYNNVSVTAAMSGETDNGLTFGASLTFRAGNDVDLDVGDLGDNLENEFSDVDDVDNDVGNVDLGNIYVSGGFGKLTFDRDGIDNVHDDEIQHDVMYEHTLGNVAFSATYNLDNGDTVGDEYSAKVAYTANPVTFTFKTDDSGEADATLAYVMNDMITASINYDTDGQTIDAIEAKKTTVKAAYSNNGLTAHLALADDDDDQWELGLGYAANDLSVVAVIAENDGGDSTETDLTASYDLGGGISINAATNESGAFFIGSKMSF